MLFFLHAVLWGVITGFLSGMFGIGGSIISTPALRLAMSVPAGIALGTTLPVIFPTTAVAGYSFYKAGHVNMNVVRHSAPAGIIGSVIGAYSTAFIDPRYLMVLTGIIIMVVAISFFTTRAVTITPHFSQAKAGVIGALAGLISGLLGVGGGIILIPGFYFYLGLPIKMAMGTSLVVITILAIPGSVIHYLLGHIDWMLFLGLSIGVVPGSRWGARYTIKAQEHSIKNTFGIFLIMVGIVFIIYELVELGVLRR